MQTGSVGAAGGGLSHGAKAVWIRGVVGDGSTDSGGCGKIAGHTRARACVLAADALGTETRLALRPHTAVRPIGLESATSIRAVVSGHALCVAGTDIVAGTSVAQEWATGTRT